MKDCSGVILSSLKFSRYAITHRAAIGFHTDDLVAVVRGHSDDIAHGQLFGLGLGRAEDVAVFLPSTFKQPEIVPDFFDLFTIENYAFRGAPAKLEDDSLIANLLTVFNPIDCDWNPKQFRQDVRRCLMADGGLNIVARFGD
jgi:hypothetical protein